MTQKFGLIFDPQELQVLQYNLAIMQNDIRLQYQQAIDESHHGYPAIVETIHTGSRGRPSIRIDPEFLRWSYSLRSIKSISVFLGVSRRIVRQQLLENGIAQSGEQPFVFSSQISSPTHSTSNADSDPELELEDNDLLDPSSSTHDAIPQTPLRVDCDLEAPVDQTLCITSYTAPQSDISDGEIDDPVLHLHRHFRRAGISMLDCMLCRLGCRIPRECIQQSLICVDPVHRIFQCIRIQCRVYNVPGPNSLWHHYRQHGTVILTSKF
jgi:hypothetical protein